MYLAFQFATVEYQSDGFLYGVDTGFSVFRGDRGFIKNAL
jgi:hypothetical protein